MNSMRVSGIRIAIRNLLAPSLVGVIRIGLVIASLGGGLAGQDFTQLAKPNEKVAGYIGGRLASVNALIRLDAARRLFAVDGAGITVAVLGTGLNLSHEDFQGKVVIGKSFLGGGDDGDHDRHGVSSHISGIMVGRAGIAPRAKIIPVKVANDSGAGNWRAVRDAFDWILRQDQHRISVVLCDVHEGNYQNNPIARGEMQAIAVLIRQLREKGVAVVAPAGDAFGRLKSQSGMAYPAIIPEVISVAAVYDSQGGPREYQNKVMAFRTQADQITPYSQRLVKTAAEGMGTDFLAPGGPLTSSGVQGSNSQAVIEGTSQAAAVVAGVIALLQHRYLQLEGKLPEVSQIENWLLAAAAPVVDKEEKEPYDNVSHTKATYRRIDALAGLQAIRPSKVPAIAVGTACPLDETWNSFTRAERFETAEVRRLYRVSGKDTTAALLVGRIPQQPAFAQRLLLPEDPPPILGDGCFAANIAGLVAGGPPNLGAAPGARLIALQAEGGDMLNLELMDKALEWVLKHREQQHITVVLCPQHDKSNLRPSNRPTHDLYARIADKVRALRDARIPVVASAGDGFGQEQGMAFPAIVSETISVGALALLAEAQPMGERTTRQTPFGIEDDKGTHVLAEYSQRLDDDQGGLHRTDLFAFGGPLISVGGEANRPSAGRGTSQAAACVTGVILLMQEHFRRATGELPTVDDLERWLRDGGTAVGRVEKDSQLAPASREMRALDPTGALRAVHRDVERKIMVGAAK
jgi:subtilisin family serine protease